MFNNYLRLFTRFLQDNWEAVNREAFNGRLKRPVFSISEGRGVLGSWDRSTRTLSISTYLLMNFSILEILETLKHEMAHQFADEILDADKDPAETAHGGRFRYACDRLGISHSSRLATKGQVPPILAKIRKLLALAESPNVHEAEAAMTRARALMERYELDLGVRDHDFCYAYLGFPRKQKSSVERFIASVLLRFFGVELVWVPSSLLHPERRVWLIEICGTSAALEVAEYVYDYLRLELELLWRAQQYRNPMLKGRSSKRDFQLGVMQGLFEKLEAEEAAATTPAEGRQLILLKRDKLREFYNDRHPRLRKARAFTYRETDAYHAGVAEGKNLDIHQGIKGRKGGTRRLGSGR
ncbi:MAG: DUF2786 domain-containing protein [Acidobacteriota bacterium]|nr:DUF2786 domain-containing protein [Acidobacteriota bacterium]